jgi:DNA-binding MarR family transcriptional regulator
LLGFRSRSTSEESNRAKEGDVAKLFFDAFSRRVLSVEEGLRALSSEVGKLRLSSDRSQISDLVLLGRLQKAEETLKESLGWVKRVADTVASRGEGTKQFVGPISQASPVPLPSPMVAPVQKTPPVGSELGSLPSITTPTELQVLTLLAEEGAKSAPEIGRLVGRSREHSARLMKRLYEEGYVRRDQSRIPFRYSLVERVLAGLTRSATKGEAAEEATVPPS